MNKLPTTIAALLLIVVVGCRQESHGNRLVIPDENLSVVSFAATSWGPLVVGSARPVEPLIESTWGTLMVAFRDDAWIEVHRRMGTESATRPLIVDVIERPGVAFAAGIFYTAQGREVGFLMRSVDQGRTWMDLDTPGPGAYGVDALDERRVIAWDSRSLYFSGDSGAHWLESRFSTRHVRGGPRPVILPDGTVFCILGSSSDVWHHEHMVLMLPDGTTRDLGRAGRDIDYITEHRGRVYGATRVSEKIEIVRFDISDTAAMVEQVVALDGNVVHPLQSSAGVLAVSVSTTRGGPGVDDVWVSIDEGGHWESVLPKRQARWFQDMRLAPDGSMWLRYSNISVGPWLERIEIKKTAQPGATDNPDDAQRLREDL